MIDAQRWSPAGTPATQQAVKLELTNVARAAVDTVRAGLRCGTISVTTDGPTALTLIHLRRRGAVRSGATTVALAHEGRATVTLAKGTTMLEACSDRG